MNARACLTSAFLAGIAASLAADGQTITGVIKPVDVDLRQIVGKTIPKGTRLEIAQMCTDSLVPIAFSRERITMALPSIHELPNSIGLDLATRSVNRDPKTFFGTKGDTIIGFVSAGLAAGGFGAGLKWAGWTGVGLGVLQFILASVREQAPSIAPYLGALMPDRIALDASGCATFGMIAGNAPADSVTFSITLPGTIQAAATPAPSAAVPNFQQAPMPVDQASQFKTFTSAPRARSAQGVIRANPR